jgi:hypothetical protein
MILLLRPHIAQEDRANWTFDSTAKPMYKMTALQRQLQKHHLTENALTLTSLYYRPLL